MNQLFEAFIVNLIRRHRQEILPLDLRDCDLLPQSRGATIYLAKTNNRPVFQLKPDLAFRKNGTFPLLLDAKYKRLNAADIRLGVSEDDFYQMHAYAHRYGCPSVVLIYPETTETPEPLQRRFLIGGSDKVVVVTTVNIRRELSRQEHRRLLMSELTTILGGDYGIRE